MKLSLTSVRGVGTTALCRTLHQQALADATNTREVERIMPGWRIIRLHARAEPPLGIRWLSIASPAYGKSSAAAEDALTTVRVCKIDHRHRVKITAVAD